MAETVTTILTVDARGAEAGTATYIRAAKAAQAAADRSIESSLKVIETRENESTVTIGGATSLGRLAAAYEKARAASDPLIAAQQKIEKVMLTADAAFRRGIATQEEAAATVAAFSAKVTSAAANVNAATASMSNGFMRMGELGKSQSSITRNWSPMITGMSGVGIAAEVTGKKIKGASAEMEGLSRTQSMMFKSAAFRGFESFASGQHLSTIGMQQGGEFLDAFAMSDQSAGKTLKALGSSIAGGIGSLLNPVVGITAAVGVLGVTAVAAFVSWENSQERLAASLDGVGRATGVTLDGLNKVAEAGAKVAGISGSQGRDLAAQFAGTGAFGGDMISRLIGTSKTYARVTGQDLGAAGADLAKAFADPGKGADELNKKLGFLDGATLKLIHSFQEEGNTLGAQNVMLDHLSVSINSATDRTWTWTKAWRALGDAASDALAATGRAVDHAVNGPSLDEQIQRLRGQLQARPGAQFPRFGGTAQPGDNAAARARLRDLEIQYTEEANRAALKGLDAQKISKSADIDALIGSTLPALQRQLDIIGHSKKLTDALGDPATLAKMGMSIDEVRRAIEVLNLEKIKANGLTGREEAANDIAIKSIQARTLAEREEIAVLQARQTAEYAAGDATRKAALTQSAAAQVAEQAKKSIDDTLRSSRDAAALSGLRPFQRSQLAIGQQFRDERERNSNGSSAGLDQAEILQRQTAAQEAIIGPMRQANDAVNAQIRLLGAQRDTFGATTDIVAAAAEKQRLLNEMESQGITVGSDLNRVFDEQAARYGKVQLAAEDLAKAQDRVKQSVSEVEGAFGDMVDTITGDLIGGKGKNIGKDLLKMLGGDLLKSGTNALKQNFSDLFEKPLTGFFSHMSGADKIALPGLADTKMTPLMNVTAQLVNLSGPGLGGLGLGAANNNGIGIGPAGTITSAPLGPAATGAIPGLPGVTYGGAGLNMPAAAQAIKNIESSGGNYGALGNLTKSGDRAYGAYQVMGANVPAWTQQYYGQQLTPQEFLQNKAAQDAVFQGQFGGYAAKYGPTGAAQAWFGGPGSVGQMGRTDVNGMSVGGYGGLFNKYYGQGNQGILAGSSGADALQGASAGVDQLAASTQKLQTAATQTAPALGQAASGFGDIGSSLGGIFSSIGGAIGGKSGNGALGSGIGSLLGIIPKLFGFADGTDFAPGGLSIVGERGPELMNIPRGAQIIPNHIATGMVAAPRYASNQNRPQRGGDVHHTFSPSFSIDAKGAEIGVETKIHAAVSRALTEYDKHLNRTIATRVDVARARG